MKSKQDKLVSVEIKIVRESEGFHQDVKHRLQTSARLSKIKKDKGMLGEMVRNPTWPNK